MTLSLSILRPSPALAEFVDSIVEMDFAAAATSTIKILPSMTPSLLFFYRPNRHADCCRWCFGTRGLRHRGHMHAATKLDTGIVTVCPTGPIGSYIVQLKPEAATRITGASIEEFLDRRFPLGDMFGDRDMSLLEDRLYHAKDRPERLALLESFLLQRVRRAPPDPVVARAVRLLRLAPSLPLQRLALRLDISERQLRRRFRAVVGSNPKQFARIARIARLLAERRRGSSWPQAACASGYNDQAHMIGDFHQIVGQSPGDLLGAGVQLPGMENFSVFP